MIHIALFQRSKSFVIPSFYLNISKYIYVEQYLLFKDTKLVLTIIHTEQFILLNGAKTILTLSILFIHDHCFIYSIASTNEHCFIYSISLCFST